ncbi:MAG TPA: hypothetical protein VE264_02045 [Nitrososphaera sp.]|nr:hypothetical protein [Nitrososphaera sp.]
MWSRAEPPSRQFAAQDPGSESTETKIIDIPQERVLFSLKGFQA